MSTSYKCIHQEDMEYSLVFVMRSTNEIASYA